MLAVPYIIIVRTAVESELREEYETLLNKEREVLQKQLRHESVSESKEQLKVEKEKYEADIVALYRRRLAEVRSQAVSNEFLTVAEKWFCVYINHDRRWVNVKLPWRIDCVNKMWNIVDNVTNYVTRCKLFCVNDKRI